MASWGSGAGDGGVFDRASRESSPAMARRDSGAAHWQSHDHDDLVSEADTDVTETTDMDSEVTSVAGSLTSID